jgi:tetratricopeptide (TPR) repeat protein
MLVRTISELRPRWFLIGAWIALASWPAAAYQGPAPSELPGESVASDTPQPTPAADSAGAGRSSGSVIQAADDVFPSMPRMTPSAGSTSTKQAPLLDASADEEESDPATALRLVPKTTPAAGPSPPVLGITAQQNQPPETDPQGPQPEAEGEPLKPIADPGEQEPPKVESASFKGVTPGVTQRKDLQDAWGPPRQISKQGESFVHLYAVEPFNKIEVSFSDETVSAIVIRLDRSVPAQLLADQLKLANIRPVLVSDELGQILGQSFPERGVLFAFEPHETPGQATMKVVQIILEPVSAESFMLRAETYLDTRLDASANDLANAIKLNPESARAHWLQARVLSRMENHDDALSAVDRALAREPDDPQYQVTRAEILGRLGRTSEGIEQAEAALENSEKRAHVKARALCLLGDLIGSGSDPDFQSAVDYHTRAIKTADPLAVNRHPAIRRAAKEVLIDAHLGAANDIAWGNWNEKQTSVPRWLDRASAFAEELVENDGGTAEHRLRVATRALAAYVGAQGELDPAKWVEQTLRAGQEVLAAAQDPAKKRQVQWGLGLALYDAVQICQMRSEFEQALRYGQQAVEYLELATAGKTGLAENYALGRLYFRLGAIHAVGEGNHAAAVDWFEKAVPVFDRSALHVAPHEAGRLGDTFVSMGVSYWEDGQKERAVNLTERGVSLIEVAVENGTLAKLALEVPYSNLATMHRQLGDNEQADKYFQQAIKVKDVTRK